MTQGFDADGVELNPDRDDGTRSPQARDGSYAERARRVFSLEIAGLEAVSARLGQEFDAALDLLLEGLRAGRKIIATGIGKSGHIAEKAAATFTSTGAPCVFLNGVNAVHGDLGLVCEGDMLLVFSNSGETEEIVRMIPSLARAGVRMIAITSNPRSTLARASQVHLNSGVPREACPLNLAPTASTTAMLALADALAMVLLEARGVCEEDFARFHPGGAIGRALLVRVSDVMRKDQQLPLVRGDESVRVAIGKMSASRAGAAVVVDSESGRLAGIFTHGDFARHYQQDDQVGQALVGTVMTRNPIRVRADALAVEAVRIFEKHRIDDLVVVDQNDRPVGLVDSQDLAPLRLV